MDSTIAGLIGALIGSLAGVLGAIVTSASQMRLEREKWERSVKNQQRQELLEAITEFSKIASCIFSAIVNVTVSAYGSNTVDSLFKIFDPYEQEVKNLVVRLYSASTTIAILNKEVYYSFLSVIGHLVPLHLEVLDAINSIKVEISEIKLQDSNAKVDVSAISKSKLPRKFIEAYDTHDLLIKKLSESLNLPELEHLSKMSVRSRKH